MGTIQISIGGSFSPISAKNFSAEQNGHADAVSRAIEWLSGTVLPQAIRWDHEIHAEGDSPRGPFGRDVIGG